VTEKFAGIVRCICYIIEINRSIGNFEVVLLLHSLSDMACVGEMTNSNLKD